MKRSTPAVLLALCTSAVIAGCSGSTAPPPATPSLSLPDISASAGQTVPGPPATVAPTAPAATTAAASGPASCSNASVIAGWSVARRAAMVVSAPVLNYNLATVRAAAEAGVGGILFLGSASVPTGLGTELKVALSGIALPPLVMADEEGGSVQRLAGGVTDFPSARTMAQTMTTEQVQALGERVGQQMLALGIDVDLAPVLDLDDRPGPSATNPDGTRSFSIDPNAAIAFGDSFLKGLRAGGVIPVVKHFPGLGGSLGNTDYGPASTVPYVTLQGDGLMPFRAAIAAGAPAVMVANATVPGLTTVPASISSAAVNGLLRTTIGFSGLVVTDSLSAGAITSAGYDLPHAAVAAIKAGDDLVLFGSTLTSADLARLSTAGVQADVAGIVAAVGKAVSSGQLSPARLDQAVEHVVAARGTNLCG